MNGINASNVILNKDVVNKDVIDRIYNHLFWLLKNCDPIAVPARDCIGLIFQLEQEIIKMRSDMRVYHETVEQLQANLIKTQTSYLEVRDQLLLVLDKHNIRSK